MNRGCGGGWGELCDPSSARAGCGGGRRGGLPVGPCSLPFVSCFLPLVSCFLPLVSCFLPLVSRFLPLVSCSLPLVSCFLPLVSCSLPLVSLCIAAADRFGLGNCTQVWWSFAWWCVCGEGGGEGGREGAGSALSQPLMIFVYQTDPAVRLARIPLLHLNLAAGAQATQAGAVVCHLQLQALLRQRRSAGVSGRDHGGGAQGGGGLLPGQRVGPGPGGAAVPRADGRVHRVGGRPSRAARRRCLRRPEVSPHPAPARGPNRARRSVPLRGRRAAPPAVRLGPGPPRLAVDRAPVFDTSLGERGARELRLFATASRGLLATGGAALDPPRENSRLKSNEALCEGLTRFSNPPSGTPRERARGSRRRG